VYGFTTSGALAVAALVTVQYLPGALAAPWLSGAADRFRREWRSWGRAHQVCRIGS